MRLNDDRVLANPLLGSLWRGMHQDIEQIVWRDVSDVQDPLAAEIGRQLDLDNRERVGVPRDATPLNVYAFTPDGFLRGGLVGQTVWGWLHTSLLWVTQDSRGQKLGSRLVTRAEVLARSRGMRWAQVKTTAFQARAFYESLGYSVFANLPIVVRVHGEVQESADFYLRKDL